MTNPEPLFFQDFLLESKAAQCALCGEVVLECELREVELDVPSGWAQVCAECRMGMEQA